MVVCPSFTGSYELTGLSWSHLALPRLALPWLVTMNSLCASLAWPVLDIPCLADLTSSGLAYHGLAWPCATLADYYQLPFALLDLALHCQSLNGYCELSLPGLAQPGLAWSGFFIVNCLCSGLA